MYVSIYLFIYFTALQRQRKGASQGYFPLVPKCCTCENKKVSRDDCQSLAAFKPLLYRPLAAGLAVNQSAVIAC